MITLSFIRKQGKTSYLGEVLPQLLLHVQVGFLSIFSFPIVKCVLVFLLREVFLKNFKKEKKQLIDAAQELKIVLRISSNLSTEF